MVSPITIDRFGGMLPALAAHSLPENAASDAQNCDLRFGNVKTLPTLPARSSILDSSDHIASEIDPDDIFKIAVAAKPEPADPDHIHVIANPTWSDSSAANLQFTLVGHIYISWYTDTGHSGLYELTGMGSAGDTNLAVDAIVFEAPNRIRIKYTLLTSVGFEFQFGSSGLADNTINTGGVMPSGYSIIGPCFEVGIVGDATDGHPATTITLGTAGPAVPGPLSGVASILRAGVTVATISHFDISQQDLTKLVEPTAGSEDWYDYIPSTTGEIVLQVQYPHDPERVWYYAAAALYETHVGNTPIQVEGPLSINPVKLVGETVTDDVLEAIVVQEGTRPVLDFSIETAGDVACTKMRIYRAEGAASGWRPIADVTDWSDWVDDVLAPTADAIPEYGNPPWTSADEATLFKQQAIMMPAQYALSFWQDGTTGVYLRASALYNTLIWPEEYSIYYQGETGIALVQVGDGAVFFTNAAVYWISGGDPSQLASNLLTRANRLAYSGLAAPYDVPSLCRDGDALYYIFRDTTTVSGETLAGLVMVAGGQTKVISEPFFTALAFGDLVDGWGVATTIVRAADGMVWFGTETGGYVLQRVLDGSGGFALVKYDYNDSDYVFWKSKQWLFDTPQNFSVLAYQGATSADISVDTDGTDVSATTVANKGTLDITTPNGVRALQVLVENADPHTGTLDMKRLAIFSRVPVQVADQPIRLTPSDVAPNGPFWCVFQNAGRFRGGILYSKAGGGTVTLTPRTGTEEPATTSSNTWFSLTTGTTTSDQWKVAVTASSWEVLELYPQVRIPVKQSGLSLKGRLAADLRNVTLAFEKSGRFQVARVYADAYPVTLSLNGVTQSIASSEDALITTPGTPRREWPFDLYGCNEVYALDLIPDAVYPVRNGKVTLARGEGPVTWLARQVYSPVPVVFMVARVSARVYTGLTFSLYREGETSASFTKAITNSDSFLLPRAEPARAWRIDITGADNSEIVELVEMATSTERLR